MAVYAPNEPHNRKRLWKELADNIDKKRKWVVVGDFNMVEDALDRKGGSRKVVTSGEKRVWRRFVCKICLEDSHVYKVGNLRYSWDNKNIQT